MWFLLSTNETRCSPKEGEVNETSGTYVGDFFSFPLNGVAEIFLHHPHGCHGVGAQRLDDLQRSHETILVDFPENDVEFVSRFFKNTWA